MNNINFVRGIFLMAVALLFGLASLNYQVGQFSRSGPGLFPLLVSAMLFVVGLVTLIRSRFVDPEPFPVKFKNIVVILLSLCGFVLVSHFVNMIAGIVFLVFFSSLANAKISHKRSLKIVLGLIAVAYVFRNLLGLNLPLL
jgi:Tripartite tricarboxylate transporter TctB family